MAGTGRGRAMTMDVPKKAVGGRGGAKAAPAKPLPSKELIAAAGDYWDANKTKNAAASKEKKAKDKVHKLMVAENLDTFDFTGVHNGSETPVRAEIAAGVADVISVAKLKTLVDPDTFMKVISATKTAVEAECGSDIVMRATVTVTTDPALKIGAIKD